VSLSSPHFFSPISWPGLIAALRTRHPPLRKIDRAAEEAHAADKPGNGPDLRSVPMQLPHVGTAVMRVENIVPASGAGYSALQLFQTTFRISV